MSVKISFVVIGYNVRDYIEKCIESILSQKGFAAASADGVSDDAEGAAGGTAAEVVFVNDGSTDDTLELVSKYKDRIKIINKPNGGIVSARKAGLLAAEGEYVTFVDGDDWVNEDFLSSFLVPLLSGEEIDIVCSDYYQQKPDGSFSVKKCRRRAGSGEASGHTAKTGAGAGAGEVCSGYEYFHEIISEKIEHQLIGKVYRREFVLQAGYPSYPEISMAEDWLTNSFFGLYKPRVVFIDSTNYYYRFNASSISRKGDRKILEQIKTLEHMEAFFKEKCDFDYSEEMEFLWFAYVRTYVTGAVEPSVKKELVRVFKSKKIDYRKNALCRDAIRRMGRRKRLVLMLQLL